MALINVLSDLQMKGAKFRLHTYTELPTTATEGEIIVKDGIVYAFITTGGQQQWVPLTNKREMYIHTQTEPSTNWIVNHNLGTNDLIYSVYNNSGQIEFATVTYDTLDTMNINLVGQITGKCVVWGLSEKFAGYNSCNGDIKNTAANSTLQISTGEPTEDTQSTLYFQIDGQ